MHSRTMPLYTMSCRYGNRTVTDCQWSMKFSQVYMSWILEYCLICLRDKIRYQHWIFNIYCSWCFLLFVFYFFLIKIVSFTYSVHVCTFFYFNSLIRHVLFHCMGTHIIRGLKRIFSRVIINNIYFAHLQLVLIRFFGALGNIRTKIEQVVRNN